MKLKTIDWKELKKKDIVRVFGRSGPYTLINEEKFYTGVPSGEYVVDILADDGIHVFRGISHFFIYMGNERKSLAGLLAPHKIKKVLTKK